jgi:TP901 family phage tail tape measure protein
MSDYLIGADFTANDKISPKLKVMDAECKRFKQSASATLGSVFKGSFLGTMGANVALAGLNQVRAGISDVVSEYMQLDTTLNEAAVKFGNIDYGSDKFKEISKVARQVGMTTKFTSYDAAGGLEALAGAGFEAANAINLLPSVANFAAAAKMGLADATEIAGKSLNVFAMNSKDAATQAKNFTRISDVMAEADRMSMATMGGLAESVAWGASEFTTAGQSIESFMAIAAGLADVGKEGSVGGTVLRGMANDLNNLSGKGKKAFKELGLSQKDFMDPKNPRKIGDYLDLLRKMEAGLKKFDQRKKMQILGSIFDVRSAGGIMAMLNAGTDKLVGYRSHLEQTTGSAKVMGEQLNKSLTFRVQELQNAFQEKGFQIFEGFLTDGRGGIENMIDAVNKWDIKPIVDGLNNLGSAVSFLTKHSDAIYRIGIGFLTIKGAMLGMDAFTWAMSLKTAIRGVAAESRLLMPLGAFLRGGSVMAPTPAMTSMALTGAAPMAVGAAGAAVPTATAASVATVSKMSIASIGSVVFAAGAAALIGWEIGDAIRTKFVDPAIDKGFKTGEESLDLGLKLQAALYKSTPEEKAALIQEGRTGLDQLNPLFPQYKQQYESLGGNVAALQIAMEQQIREIDRLAKMKTVMTPGGWNYAGIYDTTGGQTENKIPSKTYEETFHDLWMRPREKTGMSAKEIAAEVDKVRSVRRERYIDAILKRLPEKSTVEVNINVEGEGAGKVTATTKTKGKRAPKVEVKRAGAN